MIILDLEVLRGSFFSADLRVQSKIAFCTNLLDRIETRGKGAALDPGTTISAKGCISRQVICRAQKVRKLITLVWVMSTLWILILDSVPDVVPILRLPEINHV